MNTRTALMVVTLAAALLFAPQMVGAATLTLNLNPLMFALPGQSVNFTGTVTAPASNSTPVYLNSDNANVEAPLGLDDSPFFNNFPLFLNPGQSVTAVLFTVNFPVGTPTGTYTGSFAITGGVSSSDFDPLTPSAQFQVATAPEPGSWLMLLACLAIIGDMSRKRRPRT